MRKADDKITSTFATDAVAAHVVLPTVGMLGLMVDGVAGLLTVAVGVVVLVVGGVIVVWAENGKN